MPVAIKRGSIKGEIKEMWPMLIVAAFSTFLDQLTKILVRRAVSTSGAIRVVEGWLHLTYAQNSGMAFGMLRGWSHVLTFVSTFAIVFIFMYYKQLKPTGWMKISLGLVLGGVLGNLVDRVLYGYVTDFVYIRWWPSFNMGDSCICVGVVMLVIGMFKRSMSMDLGDQMEMANHPSPDDANPPQNGN